MRPCLTASRLLLPALLLALATAAHAQILSVYGTYSPVNASNVQTGIVTTPTTSQTQYTSFWASGIGGGATFNFLPLPIVSLGLDVRGSTKPGTVGADTAMAGLKLGIHPPVIHIKPYVQGSVGYLATRTVNQTSNTTFLGLTTSPGGTFNNQYLTYEIFGGVDYPLMHFIDLRLIEVGGGKAMNIGSSANATLFTINSGIVLHF